MKKNVHVSCRKPGLKLRLIGAMVLSVTAGGLAQAEPLPKEAVLPLALAQKAAAAGLAKCEEGGYTVSVAIADRGGNLKVLLRGDGAGPHTTDSSFRKALYRGEFATFHACTWLNSSPKFPVSKPCGI